MGRTTSGATKVVCQAEFASGAIIQQHMAENQTGLSTTMQAAVTELQHMVRQNYPDASFDVFQGEDPDGTYVRATVDVDDSDAVTDVVIDRLVQLQVDEGLSIYFVPVRPLEKVLAELQAPRRRIRPRIELEEGRLTF